MDHSEEKINKIIINENNNNYNKELEKLLELGFDKEKAYEAINYSKGKIELAIEYLYNGIQNNKNENKNNLIEPNLSNNDDENGEDFEDVTYLLKKLSSIFKLLLKEKKKTKDEIFEIIQKNNFSLFQFIKENEGEFNSYFSSPIKKDDYMIFEDFKLGKENFGIYNLKYRIFDFVGKNYMCDTDDNNINNIIENDDEEKGNSFEKYYLGNDKCNDKDKEIINKIKELGNFNEDEVIQAYFACDKNEELTANYLFEHINNNVIN